MGLLCPNDAKPDSVHLSRSHTEMLTAGPARFDYTAGVQVMVPPVHWLTRRSFKHHKPKIHNKLTRCRRPHLFLLITPMWFIVTSTTKRREFYYRLVSHKLRTVDLWPALWGTETDGKARYNYDNGCQLCHWIFTTALFFYPLCSLLLINSIDQCDLKVSFGCSYYFFIWDLDFTASKWFWNRGCIFWISQWSDIEVL